MTLEGGVPGTLIPLFLMVRELVLRVCGNPVPRRPQFPSEYAVYSSLVLFHGVAIFEQLIAECAFYRTAFASKLVFSKVAPDPGQLPLEEDILRSFHF